MLVGIQGKMGAGKTLTMSILATYLQKKTKLPVWANYSLEKSLAIQSTADIWEAQNGVMCFDELWLTMDARAWKDNVDLSRFINQSRKKGLIVLYTTQHIRQVEQRVRNATDILIHCEKKDKRTVLYFIDWQYREIIGTYHMDNPAPFYSLYNTFEVLQPLNKL